MESIPSVLPWLRHEGGVVHSVSVDPVGKRIASAGGWWLCLWDASHLNSSRSAPRLPLSAVNFYPQTLNVAQWDPRGYQLAFGGDVGYVGLLRKIDGPGFAVLDRETTELKQNWQEVVRLLGHKSDVIDIAWSSPTTLASASVDNSIIVWNVQTQERLKRLESHRSFVKAVAWSPNGDLLASLADDRRLIVWRLPEGVIEATVTKPFEKSPVSTCSAMKIDWSPNGEKLVAVHATKSDDVQLCVVVSRRDWSYEYRGIEGHGSISLAQFNPYRFSTSSTLCYYWASAGTRGVISVWREVESGNGDPTEKEPVASTVVEGTVVDLCWCPDGYTLLIAVSEGVVLKWRFSAELLGSRSPSSDVTGSVLEPDGGPEVAVRTVNRPLKPVIRRRALGKRIAPMRVEEAEKEMAEMSPTKRRRLKSLNPIDVTSPIRASLRVPIKGRRGHLYELTIQNRHPTEKGESVVIYQELGRVVWGLRLDRSVACGAANESFLCLITADWHLMVFRLKSATLLLPMQPLECPVQSMSCDTSTTLLIVFSDKFISRWDLNEVHEKDRISYRAISLPRWETEDTPIEASYTANGSIELHFTSISYVYCPNRRNWTESENLTHPDAQHPIPGSDPIPPQLQLQEGEAIPEVFTELEASLHRAQANQDLKALHRAVLELMYRILSDSTPQSYWRARKLLYLTESVLSSSVLFPSYFRKLYFKELFAELSRRPCRALQRDVLLFISSTDAI